MNDLPTAAEVPLAAMQARLRQLVELESPTEAPEAVNAAVGLVAEWAEQAGAAVTRHPGAPGFGDALELRFGDHAAGGKPLLLLGHLDTVWPLGTLTRMPWRESGGRLFGPGVLDMKGGVVMALAALALRSRPARPVTLLLNPDEEVGSPSSRALTERLALASAAVFVLEPAQELAYKTARKGIGNFRLKVTGVGAHSGVDFTAGHSAILELAFQIERISGLTDLARGLTVNCGVVSGGTRSNVVAEHAVTEIDVRIARIADAAAIEHQLRSLTPRDPACTLELSGGINRPPMERTAAIAGLFAQARTLAAGLPSGLAFQLDEAATGGASDGNFTAALGIPTLDGMGAVGEGAHAAHESLLIEHLAPRTALLAALLDHVEV